MGNSAFNQQVPLSQPPRTPGGRLTLATGTPVMTSEQANKTTIYYTPYVNDQVPIYDGSAWKNFTFAELSLAMAASANWAADTNYDLYVVNDGGTLRLGTGAAWTNGTTRSESLTRVNGIYTNAASMTLRYGASSTLTAAANTATYVGTFRTTASTGTTTWELGGLASGGDPVFLYLWNCYQREPVSVGVRDSDDSWSYATASWRSFNNSTSNRFSFVRGLNEGAVQCDFFELARIQDNQNAAWGICLDATNSYNQVAGISSNPSTGHQLQNASTAMYVGWPGLGYHFLQLTEYGAPDGGSGAAVFQGDAGAPSFVQTGATFSGMF